MLIHLDSVAMKLLLQHANGENAWIGIDGNTGAISDMKERKVGIQWSLNSPHISVVIIIIIIIISLL